MRVVRDKTGVENMTNKERYWARRNAGLCVRCGKPASKSRCPECMQDLQFAATKWRKGRVAVLRQRIWELEQELEEARKGEAHGNV